MKQSNRFITISWVLLISVYLLILVGGIVRSTSSGMGCPDWPKCFGQWYPPTSAQQLPSDYEQQFLAKRLQKNNRIAQLLDKFGMTKLADDIRSEQQVDKKIPFDVTKAWIEYLNRLLGVIIGLLTLIFFRYAFNYWQKKRKVVWIACTALVVLIIQGWLGSVVVSTHLLPWMVTVHMLLAIVFTFLIILAMFQTYKEDNLPLKSSIFTWLVLALLVISVFQIILGTNLRESIEFIAEVLENQLRFEWVQRAGFDFKWHRSFSWFVLVLHAVVVYFFTKLAFKSKLLLNLLKAIVVIVILEIGCGIILAYFSIPAFAQPIHLILANVLIGLQFTLFLQSLNQNNLSVNQ